MYHLFTFSFRANVQLLGQARSDQLLKLSTDQIPSHQLNPRVEPIRLRPDRALGVETEKCTTSATITSS